MLGLGAEPLRGRRRRRDGGERIRAQEAAKSRSNRSARERIITVRADAVGEDLLLLVRTVRIRHADVLDPSKTNAVREFRYFSLDVVMEEDALDDTVELTIGAVGMLTVGKRHDGDVDVIWRLDRGHGEGEFNRD